jgi:hypothetical protein
VLIFPWLFGALTLPCPVWLFTGSISCVIDCLAIKRGVKTGVTEVADIPVFVGLGVASPNVSQHPRPIRARHAAITPSQTPQIWWWIENAMLDANANINAITSITLTELFK